MIPWPRGWRRPPLPITTAVIALLLLGPAAALFRLPRPQAEGLDQLMDTASLLQSFAASPQRPTPPLWLERMGKPLADRLWKQQRRPWWQFWGPHADGAPYLALPAASLPPLPPGAPLPAGAVRVGDLVVFSPDPLSRQLLLDRLRPGKRPSRGLQRRCLRLIQQEQAVYWSPSALGVIVGPLAPLLQPYQAGCLSLALQNQGLGWQGEAAAVDGVLAAPEAAPAPVVTEAFEPLADDQLLEIRGGSLDPLLQGLLARQLIRDPLARRYGISADRLTLLRDAPFRLRLRPRTSGPFQASLELQLIAPRGRAPWLPLLAGVSKALKEQGLKEGAEPVAAAKPVPGAEPSATPPEAKEPPSSSAKPAARASAAPPVDGATWRRDDGVVVGGWRWIPGTGKEAQLLLFLGPVPPSLPPIPQGAGERPPAGELLLRVRPRALDALGLLPMEMPALVRRADQLATRARPLAGVQGPSQPISRLTGALQVPR
ncbi:hypothetical protein NZK32_07115 [Cyanobium sp. FGCU-52]|nr:hypothetical protein [Cyanobium sp. FGCU52]